MVSTLEEIDGELVITLPQEILGILGWKSGVELKWDISETGEISISLAE